MKQALRDAAIEMSVPDARAKVAEYLKAVRERHHKEDVAILRGYRALAKGHSVIDLPHVIGLGGVFEDNGLPRLAVATSSHEFVYVLRQSDGHVTFDYDNGNRWRRPQNARKNIYRFPAHTLPERSKDTVPGLAGLDVPLPLDGTTGQAVTFGEHGLTGTPDTGRLFVDGEAREQLPGHTLVITAYGKPITQGSKTKNRWAGVRDDNAATLHPWRDNVRSAALTYTDDENYQRLDGPICVTILFCFDRPTTHYRTGRNAHLLRDAAPAYPDNKGSGDIDKLVRACLDALTDAGVWRDDSRVVRLKDVDKAYVGSRPDALDRPGCLIRVWALS